MDPLGRLRLWLSSLFVLAVLPTATAGAAEPGLSIPVLLYHRLGPTSPDEMTVTVPVFAAQLARLAEHGAVVVPAAALLAALGDATPLPERAVVLTVDDGHRSVYTDLFPLIRRARLPVTLFIYPTAISNASYALTWEQLAEMKASGLVDVQSHTFWHPNFAVEKKRLTPEAYRRFVQDQLVRSRTVLAQKLGGTVDQLAWAFGIHDDELEQAAGEAGYRAAWTIERRPVTRADRRLALPRYIVTDLDRGARFDNLLQGLTR